MSVQDALDKISDRHPDVIGAMVSANGKVWHNLEAPYDMVSADTIMETLGDILDQSELLADEGYDFSDVMMDFDQHSFIVRSIDGGLLVVLAPRLQRGQLVKLQVGLGLFGKSVQKAIAEDMTPANTPAPLTATPQQQQPISGQDEVSPHGDADVPADVSDAFASAKAIAAAAEPAADDSVGSGRTAGRRSRTGAIADRLARRRQDEGVDAISATEPGSAAEPTTAQTDTADPDAPPVGPDGRPLKKRIYRGVVFYE